MSVDPALVAMIQKQAFRGYAMGDAHDYSFGSVTPANAVTGSLLGTAVNVAPNSVAGGYWLGTAMTQVYANPATHATAAHGRVFTVAIGPQGQFAAGMGAAIGFGVYFSNLPEIGIYGSTASVGGLALGVAGTITLSIVFGGPSVLGGMCYALAINASVAPFTGGIAALFNNSGQLIGFTGEVGIAYGPLPVEITAQVSNTSIAPIWSPATP
ncbi:MAG: hypothetical protein KDA49_03005 [Rhodospirillaceae bacterium]|nr:hypothetical protein [Rhodospirillaceae bacterium]MCA8931406.1 hypothetical protein [Rhodospirillaceae bacterium]